MLTKEEATVYVRELDLFVTVMLLEDTLAVLSLGKLCENHGYTYHWTSGQKPQLFKNGRRIECNTANYVPFAVLPGLSTSFSSSSLPSTSMTPSRQECNHPTSSSSSSTSPTTTVLSDRDSNKGRSEWDRFPSSTCVKFTCWTNRTGRPVVAQANQKSKTK